MTNSDFWVSIRKIIEDGFTPEGLKRLNYYAEQFISGRLVYKRFSPREQHGCATGGETNVIASILAGAEDRADTDSPKNVSDFERECQQGKKQENCIELWAKSIGCWTDSIDDVLQQTLGEGIAEGGEAVVFDHGATLVKSIGLDYFITPILALDRIALHNTYFPETGLSVLGFGRNKDGEFKILVEQPYIRGSHLSDDEIEEYMEHMGFELKNPRNWTYATPDIYLSDMHDENVIRSVDGPICVVDCDIRINTPELRSGGTRVLTTDVSFHVDFEDAF
ncbi:MAG: hypothetical protein IJ897_02620 [Prevotella sp.]|nr:hypothetical protein [Prevotella sp.]MBR4573136.1 hypothetical protein [Prevotella sp.]